MATYNQTKRMAYAYIERLLASDLPIAKIRYIMAMRYGYGGSQIDKMISIIQENKQENEGSPQETIGGPGDPQEKDQDFIFNKPKKEKK